MVAVSNSVQIDPVELEPNSSGMAIGTALVVPLALLLIFGIVDGVRAVWAQSILQFTVDQMVRWGQVHSSNGIGAVLDYAHRDLDLPSPHNSNMALTVTSGPTRVGIQVRYTFTYWAPKAVRLIVPGVSKSGQTILYATAQLPV